MTKIRHKLHFHKARMCQAGHILVGNLAFTCMTLNNTWSVKLIGTDVDIQAFAELDQHLVHLEWDI